MSRMFEVKQLLIGPEKEVERKSCAFLESLLALRSASAAVTSVTSAMAASNITDDTQGYS